MKDTLTSHILMWGSVKYRYFEMFTAATRQL